MHLPSLHLPSVATALIVVHGNSSIDPAMKRKPT
jgi:hypothetical protein